MTAEANTTFEPMTWVLTPGEYAATVAKIEKINERAQRKGFTGSLSVEGVREERTTTNALTGIETTEIVWNTRVVGEAPSYGGYTFLARIDRVGETFVISSAPGVESVDRSLVHAGECDHCGYNRQRNNTYLVRNNATGETVNVGSTCIKDFLGWSASVTFFSNSDMEPAEGGFYAVREYSVETVLALAYAAIKTHGWVARSSYDSTPTADLVAMALSGRRLTEHEEAIVRGLRAHAEEATSMVQAVKAYILSDDFNGHSTYVENLKVLVAQDAVSARQFGLLASAPQAYIRATEAAVAKAAKPVSEHVGEVKDKVTVKGSIESIRYIHGNYGTTTLYTILGEDGNLYKWFSSAGTLGEDEGVAVHIVGTVKAHDEYNDTKSTVLTRCKTI